MTSHLLSRLNLPLSITGVFAMSFTALAADQAKKWEKMDYGPFLSATIDLPNNNTTIKGILVPLGKDHDAVVCYDTDLLRVAAAWTGGGITLRGVVFDGAHGPNPSPKGHIVCSTKSGPGWASGNTFADPRKVVTDKDRQNSPISFGPLPAEWAKYRGLFLSGDKTVFSYTVGDAEVLEMPGVETVDGVSAITRTIQIARSSKPLTLLVTEVQAEGALGRIDGNTATLNYTDSREAAAFVGAPLGTRWEVGMPPRATPAPGNVGVMLKLPAITAPVVFKIVLWQGASADLPKFADVLKASPKPVNLTAFCKGGASRWNEKIETRGTLGKADDAYAVDTITVPFENPWNSWMRIGGFDFFADGKRAAVCTWSGDVWIVSGIDDKLEHVTWKRFATGLFQPLGLKIVDEKIYVHGRDQITRLHDLNNDGEADFYENFNNDIQATPGFHEFAFDLQTDSKGNFYIAKAGPVRPGGRGFQVYGDHNGTILKISPDGKKTEVFATGLRAPNGFCVGPNDVVTTGDNEGSWVPSSYVSFVKQGGFLGVSELAHRAGKPEIYDPRICWLPHGTTDNSCGGQAWVPDDRWGPFKGQLLHLSYGKSSLFLVPFETVEGVAQGGAVRMPLQFDSGVMRARFNKIDGQLYLAGLKGWQTNATKDGCFQRVRFTGKPIAIPSELHFTDAGIHVGFSAALDEKEATDPQNYTVEQWNYKWSDEYGSAEYKPSEPGAKGHDPVEIKSVKLSADKRTVVLETASLAPVMQIKIKFGIKAADGAEVNNEIYGTINKVGREGAVKSAAK